MAVPAFLSGEAKGGQDILGGKSIWLPMAVMNFHNTGHIGLPNV